MYAATALSSVGSKLSKHFSSIFPYNAALYVVQYPLLLFNIIHGSPHKLLTAKPSQTEMAMKLAMVRYIHKMYRSKGGYDESVRNGGNGTVLLKQDKKKFKRPSLRDEKRFTVNLHYQ